jgi:hypothetical protein
MIQYKKILAIVFILSLTSFASSGCRDGRPARVPVSGKVLIDGTPLTMGNVTFYSKTSSGRPSYGTIQPDGSFSLFTFKENDGAPLGTFDVTVTSKEFLSKGLEPEKYRSLIPLKYAVATTSGIEKTIDKSTDDMEISLTWQGSGFTKPYVVNDGKIIKD